MDKTFEPFSEVIREKRIQARLTQRELAVKLGVSPGYISQLERGAVPSPTVREELSRIFEAESTAPAEEGAPPQTGSVQILLEEIAAARAELGKPMGAAERDSLAAAEPGEVLNQSVLLREALEVRASRELLAGAEAFRKKRERVRRGGTSQ